MQIKSLTLAGLTIISAFLSLFATACFKVPFEVSLSKLSANVDGLPTGERLVIVAPVQPPASQSACEKRFASPDKTSITRVRINFTANTLNFGLPPSQVYVETTDLGQIDPLKIRELIDAGSLVVAGTIPAQEEGFTGSVDVTINEENRGTFNSEVLSQNTNIVLISDPVSEAKPSGSISISPSIELTATAGLGDLDCAGEFSNKG